MHRVKQQVTTQPSALKTLVNPQHAQQDNRNLLEGAFRAIQPDVSARVTDCALSV